jgi:general secretion pathway protein C
LERSKTKKRAFSRIPKKAESRIVELSLENPDFGAKRLSSLLKKENIKVSQSWVYGILRHHDLQTLEKRLAKLKPKAPPPKKKSATAKSQTTAADEIEEQVIAASLQNPDFGAQRLVAVLKDENILVSASAVYAVLRRSGLQNRDARRKKIQDKIEKPAPLSKSFSAAISPEDEDRIVEISMQNPELGAKRLLPLLNGSGIETSTSRVYSILKRRGLQTRELRVARLGEPNNAKDTLKSEKGATKLTPEIEDRIVDVSLENPDYGALRLARLLNEEGISISSSAIYNLLKRQGLQTRDLRQSRIELHCLTEDAPDDFEDEDPYAVPIPTMPEETEEVSEKTVDVAEKRPMAHAPIPPAKPQLRARWFFYLANVVLLAVVGYLGYLGYHAVINFKQAKLAPNGAAAVEYGQVRPAIQLPKAVQPLKEYQKVLERNLFNNTNEKNPAASESIPAEKIRLASKSLGLKLVGTVAADDSKQSVAIIDSRKNRKQEAFHEGDKIGKVKIKKIQRNKVIITTEKGDELLIIDPKRIAKKNSSSSPKVDTDDGQSAPPKKDLIGQSQIRRGEFRVTRKFATAFLGDPEEFLENMQISPYIEDDQPSGFQINGITPNNPLGKMGLQDGDVILAINQEAITDQQQAVDFIKKLQEGGDIKIKVKRNQKQRIVRLIVE